MATLHFIERDGTIRTVEAQNGLSVLEVAHKYDIDIEGACGGSLACATCHVIVKEEDFDRLDEAQEEEEDMLDLAFDLQKTSRLCCQIIVSDKISGMTFKLPSATRNILS